MQCPHCRQTFVNAGSLAKHRSHLHKNQHLAEGPDSESEYEDEEDQYDYFDAVENFEYVEVEDAARVEEEEIVSEIGADDFAERAMDLVHEHVEPSGESERLRTIWRHASPEFRQRLQSCLTFADPRYTALDMQGSFELIGLSEEDCTTLALKFAKDLPSTKTRKRWLRHLMYLFYGDSALPRKVSFRYRHSSLGSQAQYVNGFHNDLKANISSLLEDPRFSNMANMFTGDAARNESLDVNVLPGGEQKLAGEPMNASFCRDMNAYILQKWSQRAFELGCVGVLPVSVIASFDGMSPDQALNKSF
jgi:hypothetical protein